MMPTSDVIAYKINTVSDMTYKRYLFVFIKNTFSSDPKFR